MNKKLIAIIGPTASGKSSLAVKLAKEFNGEVISADSRQIYKGMDIGTGKITKKEMNSIPHHLLGVVSPKTRFTVVRYRKLAIKAIDKIQKKNKIPIICGGTGLYIQSIIDGITIPEVKPDLKLRKELEKLTTEQLFKKLKKLDKKRSETIDKDNGRRLIRALEIVIKTKKPVPSLEKNTLPYPFLIIGIKKEKKELEKLIKKRFFEWLKLGFLKEVLNLKKTGLSWKKIEEFGIHYKTGSLYIQHKITEKEFIEKSLIELNNYAKRQMIWFKKDNRINWVKNYKETIKITKNLLKIKSGGK
ncbi:MAG: tRNA (adenosine(37)-N6)-dimethylallyltransferase MiaA [Candidatus Nealsonbacteria bacterium]